MFECRLGEFGDRIRELHQDLYAMLAGEIATEDTISARYVRGKLEG